MQSAPAGLWDPHGPQYEDVSLPLPLHPPSASRLSHVITAPPAKRITFYKRGDNQFAGVRMAVHKRSFKCFDALLDDLSQKVPLPFGVRTVTTPRGIHSIKHLEQLEDGGCYLCSDRRQTKPINMELAGKRPALWHHNSRRVPQRPAEDPPPPTAPNHTPTRQRRILLVRNSDPAVRRSVILSRRSTRSLRVFLEDISELMQCHVRKLYTLEGRKIDSAQSLMTCPGVLVCVGREPFRPLLLEYVTKTSEEKLPGLGTRSTGNGARSPGTGTRSPGNGQGARSRSSVCSEGHDSKKNVNFGLETKKSIIHPRSDSSNRSTRFSLSSEKSYANGLSTCPHSHNGREAVLNDDIEKRVLVNKDGSLSVEMRVRFNLHKDETLQWSTEIKKSPSESLTNDCCPLREAQPCYLQQGQSESCSDPDSASCVAEAADYTPKPPQRSLKEPQPHCACCYQRQDPEYDLWENPAHIQTSKHSHSRVRHTHSSSSSSSCRSSRVVRRRAMHKEGSEPGRVVQECCVREEVQRRVEVERDGGMVEVCTVSRSCSRSELNLSATDNQGEECPLSSSSHVLQALQEDMDDLPPSASRCFHSNDSPQPLPLTLRPTSHLSTSSRSRKHTPAPQGEEGGEGEEERCDMGEERSSRASSRHSCHMGEERSSRASSRHSSHMGEKRSSRASSRRSCHSCSCCGGEVPPQADEERPDRSRTFNRSRSPSNRIRTPVDSDEGDDEADERAVSVMSTHTGLSGGSGGSVGSMGSSVCPHCAGCDHRSSSASCPSQRSQRSKCEEERSGSGQSGGSDESGFSQRTNRSNCTHYYQEGRAASRMSHLSLPEEGEVEVGEEREEEEEKEERAASALSAKSFSSVKGRNSRISHKSKASESLADMEEEVEGEMEGEVEGDGEVGEGEVEEEREQSAASDMSAKCNVSVKSNRSHKSYGSKAERAPSPNLSEAPATDEVGEERPASAIMAKSNLSAKSSRSHKSTCSKADGSTKASERAASPRLEPEAVEDTGAAETEGRAASVMSAKTSASAKSSRSHKSTCSQSVWAASARSETPEVPAIETTGEGEEVEEGEITDERAESSMSAKSNLSAKSSRSQKSTCSKAEQAPSPNSLEAPATEPGVDEEGERAASTMSTKTSASAKSSRSHKSSCKATSLKPAPCETPVSDPAENTEEQRALSAETRASVRSSRAHKSTCSRSVRAETPVAKDIPAIETTEGDENGSAAPAAGDTDERPASTIPAKTNTSIKSSRSHKSTKASERAVPYSFTGDNITAIESTVKSSISHKSTCIKSERASSPNSPAERAPSTNSPAERAPSTNSPAERAPSPNSPEVPVSAVDEEGERAASSMSAKTSASAKSSRSHKSTCSGSVRAETPGTNEIPVITTTGGDETTVAGDTEERPASAISAKTSSSVKSSRSHKSTCSRRAETPSSQPAHVPVIETTAGDEVGKEKEKERTASVMSAKSNASAKSHRSNRSTCNGSGRAASPVAQDVPAIETTGGKDEGDKEEEKSERPASAMSAKSTASVKSTRSHKSTSSRRPEMPASKPADVPVIETTGGDKKGEGTERPASAMSTKSAKSSRSHKSPCNNGSTRAASPAPKTADVLAIETTGVDREREERTASAMSTKSHISAKSSSSHKSNGSNRIMFPHLKKERCEKDYSTTGDDLETGIAKSAMSTKLKSKADSSTNRPVSRASQASAKSTNQTPPATTETANEEFQSQAASKAADRVDDVRNDVTEENASSVLSKSPAKAAGDSRPASAASSHSTRSKVKVEKASDAQEKDSPKTSTSDFLQVKGQGHRVRAKSDTGSVRSVKTSKTEKTVVERNYRPKSAGAGDPPSQSLNPSEGSRPTIQLETDSISDSLLSQFLSAADLLKGNVAALRPSSPAGSKVSLTESGKSGKSQRNRKPRQEEVELEELDPLCLPNTSPNDVVSDWLRGIPANSGMDNPEDEMNEGIEETEEEREEAVEKGGETEGVGGEEKQEAVENTAEQENTAETAQQEEEQEQENTAETAQQEEEQENTAETGEQEEEQEQENTAETAQQEEEQENTAETGEQEEEQEQENTAETAQQEEEQENTAETGEQEEEQEQENTAETAQQEEEQENTAETGEQEEEQEQENTAETAQQEEEQEQENTAETGQQEEEQESTAETGEQEEEQENTAETGEQEEEQENKAETGQQEEEQEQENTAETAQQEEEQENTAETAQQEEEQENTAETGQQEEGVKEAAEHPEEEEEVKEEEEERGEEEGAAVEEEKAEKEEEREEGAEEGGECSECSGFCPDPATPTNDFTSSRPRHLFLSKESELPRSCHSSVAVMKVLLSPTLGRCSSLPEISPVYGRRLSSSAKGLLDCLAQLQLIDPPHSPAAAPSPDRDQRYQEVMDILESLWLSKPDPEKRKQEEEEGKEMLKDSGVDMTSGSAGSGGSGKTRPDETAGDITPIAEGEEEGGEGEAAVTEEGEGETGDGETEGEGEAGEGETEEGEGEAGEGETKGGEEEVSSADLLSDTATPDIASRVQSSPGDDDAIPESPAGRSEMMQTPESLKAPGSPSSSNSTAYKSPTYIERDTPEDTPSSGTPPSVQRALLTKRVSQDPDPVWVLNLLKKLEKQFMTHYVDAMAEFKVRWDLDDNVMLDTMITELRDEVKKRIQTSIDRELRKIRGRAGRGGVPRPPILSRDSTVTDQRRRRLKVMKVQSVNKSDGEQGSGADVSDQRSEGEDEYCPCDACIRKKADAQQIKMEAMVTTAPVMMAFDLRRILQMKKDPEPLAPTIPMEGKNNDNLEEEKKEEEEGGNLEVVHKDEEEEETKEDIIPTVVVEEAIPEEEEEGEEEAQDSDGSESVMGEVEEEIAEEIEAEEQEEDGVVVGTEDEEEEGGESLGEDGVEGEELVEGEEEEAGDAEAVQEDQAGGDENTVDGPEEGEEVAEETGEGEETGKEEGEEEGTAEEKGGETTEGEGAVEEETEEGGTGGEEEENGGEENNVVSEFKVEEEEGEEENENSAGETSGEEVETGGEGETEGDGGEREGGEEETPEEGTEGNVTVEDAVEEFHPEEEKVEVKEGKREIPLIHQMTRTSVESQPGSMENTDPVSTMHSLTHIETKETGSDGHKMVSAGEGSGGKGQRRSRSPARAKRRKPKESDIELDDPEM